MQYYKPVAREDTPAVAAFVGMGFGIRSVPEWVWVWDKGLGLDALRC